ncbi:MAG: L-rhamnose mutarotase [Novosphingobium pentaromativorans]|uniref:L-rhamnose mutarotase n=1 Tax=Novosphingobium pentaromativorans TaxID=205844 RepID=A0A2W5NVU0_9SPHN|nr:L-rhamnose mutarotase [Novosphingobium panipatense]PZQ56458.1 MAG: L-rhamnose mutarotase [Novosphingobium pentaromativorans]
MREVLLIDLEDEAEAIARYEAWHAAGAVPGAVVGSICAAGISDMEIYRSGNRLVMVMETDPGFDPAAKAAADAADPAVQEWETLMDSVQRPLSWGSAESKWTAATRIFSLQQQTSGKG